MKAKLSDYNREQRRVVRKALQEAKADGIDRWVCWNYDGNLCYTDHPERAEDMCCIATCHPDGTIDYGFVFE